MIDMSTSEAITRSNIHSHTTFSDGRNTAEEMVQAALSLGFHTIGFSEHGPADYDDVAMPAEQMGNYRAEILRLKEKYAGELDPYCWATSTTGSPRPRTCLNTITASNPVHYVQANGELFCVD